MRIAEELEQWGVSNYDSCFAKNANSNLTNFRKLSLMRFFVSSVGNLLSGCDENGEWRKIGAINI